MKIPQPGDVIVLSEELPQYDLLAGDVGLVKSIQLEPYPACRVDFQSEFCDQVVRVTLPAERVAVLRHGASAA